LTRIGTAAAVLGAAGATATAAGLAPGSEDAGPEMMIVRPVLAGVGVGAAGAAAIAGMLTVGSPRRRAPAQRSKSSVAANAGCCTLARLRSRKVLRWLFRISSTSPRSP
jgi:hypothetical protein